MKAPLAHKQNKKLSIHGHVRIDPYYWMRHRKSKRVLDHLKTENEFTEDNLNHVGELRQSLYEEMVARLKKDDNSVPYKLDEYWYYSRVEGDGEHPIYCRKEGSLDNIEELILDANDRALGKSYYQISGLELNSTHDCMAFGEDTVGRRLYTIYIKDLSTGLIKKDRIPGTSGECCFSDDGKYLFYVKKDKKTLRENRVYRHEIGRPVSKDVLIYEERDESFSLSVGKTKSKEFIFIESGSSVSDELRYFRADDPLAEPQLFQKRKRHVEYAVEHYKDRFYVLSNYKAVNFALYSCPIANTNIEHWEIEIEGREEVLLEELEIFDTFFVLNEREKGLTRLRVLSWDRTLDLYIPFNDPTYVVGLGVNADFDSTNIRFDYTSLTTPYSVMSYEVPTGRVNILKQQEVVGDFKASNYVSERIFATSRGGVEVPISLVYKKGSKVKHGAPLLLYAYGSYGYSMDPYFSSSRLSLLDRGFIFAIAHVRGGEDLGRGWYENGKLLKKKNTFYDFIACADHLIEQGYTSSNKLFAMGGSAGGLLMGVVANWAPDRFKAIVAQVPFVDVVSTMLDESIPLTTGEYDEWGNPNQLKYYKYMLSYSPYDQVKSQAYPAMLVTTGLHDSQVQYWEPAKWVAKLRDNQLAKAPILLYCDMSAGHGGASGRYQQFKEIALEYAFILSQKP